MIKSVAIVGSGLAGTRAAEALRSEGFDGKLYLIGDEPEPPYDRPSLSKDVLSGGLADPPGLVNESWMKDAGIELIAGVAVEKLDPHSRRIELSTGSFLDSDAILLATGALARAFVAPGSTLDGIFTLRSIHDCRTLKREFHPGRSLVVVGGGLIGCEVAATARKIGLEVTIIEAAAEIMQRVLDPSTGAWCRSSIADLGIKVRLNTTVKAFCGQGHVSSVACGDGELVAADIVLVSVGAEPMTALGYAAGLACDHGYIVDGVGRTECPGVFAAGDVASWPVVGGGRRSFETYLNTQAQSAIAARAMMGISEPSPQTSLSWTRIADHHLQMAGDIAGSGDIVLRGDPAQNSFLVFRLSQGQIAGCVSANAPKDFAIARRMLGQRARIAPELLKDISVSLRDLLRSPTGERQ